MLVRVDRGNPSSTTDFVCDLCTEKFEADGQWAHLHLQDPQGREIPRRLALTAQDVAASWNKIVPSRDYDFVMVDTITAPDDDKLETRHTDIYAGAG